MQNSNNGSMPLPPANAGTAIATEQIGQPVDRKRRNRFVSRIVAFCLFVNVAFAVLTGMGYLSYNYSLIETVVTGFNTLAITLAAAYVGGSVVDYSFGGGQQRQTRWEGRRPGQFDSPFGHQPLPRQGVDPDGDPLPQTDGTQG